MPEPNRRSFEATTHSAISVVNAIPAGKGVTIAIDIPCRVRASISRRNNEESISIASGIEDPHDLVKTSARYSLTHFSFDIQKSSQLRIQISSKIPPAVGLKSSSAVSVATASAVFGLFGKEKDHKAILRASCIASKDSKASVTGAFDDAAASLLGGLVFTNNSKFKILKHQRVPKNLGSRVVILVPTDKKKLTSSINPTSYSKYRDESLNAFDYSMKGEFSSAMMLNSVIQCAALGYSIDPVSRALSEGASAAGITGKGPAVAAICRDLRTAKRIRATWLRENKSCRVLETRIVQPEATIL
ncbi:MAG: shikimate kinase [Nitrososphaerota archaeon]|nr:shikimate kinase [Nitrososphaerota archaeon]MDG6922267.1 shikimate kinase [Nitrososphaerota archaeon]